MEGLELRIEQLEKENRDLNREIGRGRGKGVVDERGGV